MPTASTSRYGGMGTHRFIGHHPTLVLCPLPAPCPSRWVSRAGYPGAGCDPWRSAYPGTCLAVPSAVCDAHVCQPGAQAGGAPCSLTAPAGDPIIAKQQGGKLWGGSGSGSPPSCSAVRPRYCLPLSPILGGAGDRKRQGLEVGQQQRGSSLHYRKGQNLHWNGSQQGCWQQGTLRGAIPPSDRDTRGLCGVLASPVTSQCLGSGHLVGPRSQRCLCAAVPRWVQRGSRPGRSPGTARRAGFEPRPGLGTMGRFRSTKGPAPTAPALAGAPLASRHGGDVGPSKAGERCPQGPTRAQTHWGAHPSVPTHARVPPTHATVPLLGSDPTVFAVGNAGYPARSMGEDAAPSKPFPHGAHRRCPNRVLGAIRPPSRMELLLVPLSVHVCPGESVLTIPPAHGGPSTSLHLRAQPGVNEHR